MLFKGAQTGPSPVDRARTGSKHHLLCDPSGIPLAATLTGGHRNDVTQLLPLVDGLGPVKGRVGRPRQLRPDRTLKRRTPLRRTGFTAASPAQRGKVAALGCLVCRGRPCDPAHLVPRRHGGCEQPDCVIPLCRTCHRAFDDGRLELLACLEPGYRAELAHALGHVSLAWLIGRVTAGRWRFDAADRDGREGREAA